MRWIETLRESLVDPSRAGQDLRVAKLGYLWFWPDAGQFGQPWSDNPEQDAFVRTSRRVTERYSEPLGELDFNARRWSQKLSVWPVADLVGEKVGDRVVVHVHHLPRREQVAHAFVPTAIIDLAPQQRARVVLEVVDAAMQSIGGRLGWPAEALTQARLRALDHHLEFEMKGTWNQNPTLDRRVRLVARIADDGWSDMCFEVADEATGRSLGFTSIEKSPANALGKFQDSIGELRWADAATVQRPDAWKVQTGTEWGGVVSADIEDLRPWPVVIRPVPERSPLSVEVRETVHGRP